MCSCILPFHFHTGFLCVGICFHSLRFVPISLSNHTGKLLAKLVLETTFVNSFCTGHKISALFLSMQMNFWFGHNVVT